MKTLFLRHIEDKSKWIPYKYLNNCNIELKKQLYQRNINIDENTKISNRVRIGNFVKIKIGTEVKDGTIIGDRSIIYNRTIINESVIIGNDVIIGSHLNIGYKTVIGDEVTIYVSTINRAIIDSKTNLIKSFYIKGSIHSIMYTGNGKLSIGCFNKKITEWLSKYKEIGEEFNYTEDQIEEYINYIKLAEIYYSKIKKGKNLQKMKTNEVRVIYLEDYDGKVERYTYMRNLELRDVLKEELLVRNIWIGENFEPGDYLFIGYNTVIGHNVITGSLIHIDCHSNIGNNVIIEDYVRINNESIIKDNTKINSYNMFLKKQKE